MLITGPDNLDAYSRMIETIRSEKSFAFAGAGVSRPLGYPTWPELLDKLAQETRAACGEAIVDTAGKPITVTEVESFPDLLLRAEIFKFNLKNLYERVMYAVFAPKKGVTADIREVARLPFQHVLTCNYDISLEIAHEELQLAFEPICVCDEAAREFVNKLCDFQYNRRIVHVHGRFDKPNSIVLTEKDYATLYDQSQIARRFWDNTPLYRSCIFFGFSFTDEDITEGFNLKNFNRAYRNGSQTPHFALLALADNNRDKQRALRASYKAKYGIDLVFFDAIDLNYAGYSRVLEKMAHDVPPAAARGLVGQPQWPSVANDVAHLEALTVLNIRKGATGDLR